jgi:hypothetical protein
VSERASGTAARTGVTEENNAEQIDIFIDLSETDFWERCQPVSTTI